MADSRCRTLFELDVLFEAKATSDRSDCWRKKGLVDASSPVEKAAAEVDAAAQTSGTGTYYSVDGTMVAGIGWVETRRVLMSAHAESSTGGGRAARSRATVSEPCEEVRMSWTTCYPSCLPVMAEPDCMTVRRESRVRDEAVCLSGSISGSLGRRRRDRAPIARGGLL